MNYYCVCEHPALWHACDPDCPGSCAVPCQFEGCTCRAYRNMDKHQGVLL